MASEIPKDIQKAAAKLLLDTRFAHDEAHHLRLLSYALLGERERCAKIAERFDPGAYCETIPEALDSCAAAIRQDNPQ